MREVVTRRYSRLQKEEGDAERDPDRRRNRPIACSAEALEALGIVNQPLASIAKREEIIYIQGQEDEPVILDRHSPVLHLVQLIRDEAHRFAVTFHRKRREIRDRKTELLDIPGIGERTRRRLLQHFGSLQAIKGADAASLAAVLNRAQVNSILQHFHRDETLSKRRKLRRGDQRELVWTSVEIPKRARIALSAGVLLVWIIGSGFDRLLVRDGVP